MRQVFTQIIDYAGLFPPASLEMSEAVAAYADYRLGPDRDMLGRFVVAASRLEEFTHAVAELTDNDIAQEPWPLSVVLGAHIPEGLAMISAAEQARVAPFTVAAVELRVGAPGEVAVIAEQLPERWERYLEVPHAEPFGPLLEAIRAAGVGAKLRMGGISPELFPSPRLVTRFLMAAIRTGVPFKATAGLHHAVRGSYPLTYAPDSAMHTMFGFLNLLVAIALLRAGEEGEVAERALRDDGPNAFVMTADGIAWRGHLLSRDELLGARTAFRGFGSCSFREPVDELAHDKVA